MILKKIDFVLESGISELTFKKYVDLLRPLAKIKKRGNFLADL